MPKTHRVLQLSNGNPQGRNYPSYEIYKGTILMRFVIPPCKNPKGEDSDYETPQALTFFTRNINHPRNSHYQTAYKIKRILEITNLHSHPIQYFPLSSDYSLKVSHYSPRAITELYNFFNAKIHDVKGSRHQLINSWDRHRHNRSDTRHLKSSEVRICLWYNRYH